MLLHGLRSHSRHTWLAKRPVCLDGKAVRTLDQVVPTLDITLQTQISSEIRNTRALYCGSWVHALNHLGFDAIGLDIQSLGESQGWKGYRCCIQDCDDPPRDLIQFLTEIVNPIYSPDIPQYAIAVSLGANILLRAMQFPEFAACRIRGEHSFLFLTRFSGAVALGAMCSMGFNFQSTLYRGLILLNRYIISRAAPGLPLVTFDLDELPDWSMKISLNTPEMYTEALNSKVRILNFLKSLRQMIDTLCQAVDRLKAAKGTLNMQDGGRLLFLHNAGDTICQAESVVEFFEQVTESRGKFHAELRIFNADSCKPESKTIQKYRIADQLKPKLELSHPLVSDIDNAEVFQMVLDFLLPVHGR